MRGRRAPEKAGGRKGAATGRSGTAAAPDRPATSCFQIGRRYEIVTSAGAIRCRLLEVSDTQLRVQRLHARGGRIELVQIENLLRATELRP